MDVIPSPLSAEPEPLGEGSMEQAALASHLEALDRDGYTILERVIEPDRVERIRERVREIEQKTLPEQESGTPVDGSSQLRTAGLLRLDPLFWEIPIHPEVLPVVEGRLAPGCLLTTFSAIDVLPGKNKQPVHPDDALIPLERPHQPIVCTCMWAITDFTEANGATRLLPGSHHASSAPDYAREYEGMLPAIMSAGSVLVIAERSSTRRTRAPLPPQSGLRIAGNGRFSVPWIPAGPLKMIVRGVSSPR